MQKNTQLIVSWVIYTTFLSVIWFFRLNLSLTLGLAAIGSLTGFLLPIVLDILLPRMMDGSAQANTDFAKDVLKESAQQIREGNLHTTSAPSTPLRSYPLLIAYVGAAIFVITSTQNWFGRGFVMGLGLSLIADLFFYRNEGTQLRERWFSVFRTNLTDHELYYFVWISVAVFAFLTLLAALA